MAAPAVSLSKKYFQQAAVDLQNFKKFCKSDDFNGAGNPSWVSRTHPSFPLTKSPALFDSLAAGAAKMAAPAVSVSLLLLSGGGPAG
ncbi:hypothetical protein [Oscillibacter sp. 1-3]|uniref:hypothetical protein n=1 Tax=Oscillibacter sp. 1-3 TaxID=1235797 RepID=UPI00039FBAAE|nr:hypothetical protein [Oscillibacter sp. 1-3]